MIIAKLIFGLWALLCICSVFTASTESGQQAHHHHLHHKSSPYHPSDYRPPYNEYQQKPSVPWCSPENLPIEAASNGGEWYLLPDGTLRYELSHCRLRRFTATMAKNCLQGNHIVFMGDSLSRYLYLSLAYFLAYNHWARRHCQVYHPNVPRSILNEKDYKEWALFYHDSNAVLNRRWPHAMEICDCFRDDRLEWNGPPGQTQDTTCYENRHFRASYSNSKGRHKDTTGKYNKYKIGDDDIQLSYIQWYGLMPMRGHRAISTKIPRNASDVQSVLSSPGVTASLASPMNLFKDFAVSLNDKVCPKPETERFFPLSKNCSLNREDLVSWDFPDFFSPDICKDDNLINDDNNPCQNFEREVLQPMQTTHLIMNIGWHDSLKHGTKNFLKKVTSAAKTLFKEGKSTGSTLRLPKVTWRSITHGAVFWWDESVPREFQAEYGKQSLGYFDVLGMTKALREIQNAIENNDDSLVRSLVKPSMWWPPEKEINSTSVLRMWTDPAHTEPWVYTEIHEVFLNAVCPLAANLPGDIRD